MPFPRPCAAPKRITFSFVQGSVALIIVDFHRSHEYVFLPFKCVFISRTRFIIQLFLLIDCFVWNVVANSTVVRACSAVVTFSIYFYVLQKKTLDAFSRSSRAIIVLSSKLLKKYPYKLFNKKFACELCRFRFSLSTRSSRPRIFAHTFPSRQSHLH